MLVDIPLLKQILQAIHAKFSEIFKMTLKKDIQDAQEQTVLASIVLIFNDGSFEIISIANGTKSVGKKNMSLKGNLIHDSHAEVLVRRAFKKFIFDNLSYPKYFKLNEQDKYSVNFKVLFYTSQTPCGQSSIFETINQEKVDIQSCGEIQIDQNQISTVKQIQNEQTQNLDQNQNKDEEKKINQNENKESNKFKDEQGKFFQNTGAKYYGFLHDEKYINEKDQLQNILRVKPGRSDLPQDSRSLSLSCSDKFLKWNVVGLQGSLLAKILDEPIYIKYLFIESDGQDTKKFKNIVKKGVYINERLSDKYSQKQIEQKVLKVFKKPINKNYILKKPCVIVTKKYFFKLNRNLNNNKPKYLDQHIVYIKSCINYNGERKEEYIEIVNGSNGMKWGMAEKGSNIAKNYPLLCKYNLFKSYEQFKHMSSSQCYLSNKQESIKYNLIKQQLIRLFKEQIVNKDIYNNFYLQ